MKTLDEVIKVFEAFTKDCSDLYEGPAQSTVSDALHYQVMQASYFGSDWWCVPFNNCGKHMQKLIPIAWMPLPEPMER